MQWSYVSKPHSINFIAWYIATADCYTEANLRVKFL